MTVLPPILQILLALLVVTAAVFDLRFRRIPNWLTFPAILVGFGMNAFLYEWTGVRSAAFGLGLAFLIYFPLYLLRGMGAGDVKLMGAVGGADPVQRTSSKDLLQCGLHVEGASLLSCALYEEGGTGRQESKSDYSSAWSDDRDRLPCVPCCGNDLGSEMT